MPFPSERLTKSRRVFTTSRLQCESLPQIMQENDNWLVQFLKDDMLLYTNFDCFIIYLAVIKAKIAIASCVYY